MNVVPPRESFDVQGKLESGSEGAETIRIGFPDAGST